VPSVVSGPNVVDGMRVRSVLMIPSIVSETCISI
jgi:hypothetical protein